jgi:hypothetical protein
VSGVLYVAKMYLAFGLVGVGSYLRAAAFDRAKL